MKQNNSMSGRNKLVLLLISSLLLAIQGCSSAAETSPEDGKQTEAAGVSTEVTAAAAETETAGPVPELPEGIDMGGKTFTILTEGFYAYDPLQIVDISTDDLNGEIFNDSIYNRNTAIEAKYNCEVKQVETEANEPTTVCQNRHTRDRPVHADNHW